jgi:preprotein translocase subunit SecG
MAILFPFLIIVHILICISLIIVVLLQSSKGEGLAGAFGGGGGLTGAVFGGRGAATFLSKATTILAVGFMVSSIVLTFVSFGVRGTTQSGVIQDLKSGPTQTLPQPASAVPGQAPSGGNTTSASGSLFNQKAPGQTQQPATQATPPAAQQPKPATPKPGSPK